MISILFICLGNICRSPMAEARMQYLIEAAGLADQIHVDSVGIGPWHAGEPAHRGTLDVLRRHGIEYTGRARQIATGDLKKADYLVAMDAENEIDVRHLMPAGVNKHVYRLLDFAPPGLPPDVPDPYYAGNFDEVYRLVDAGCQGLLTHIRAEHRL